MAAPIHEALPSDRGSNEAQRDIFPNLGPGQCEVEELGHNVKGITLNPGALAGMGLGEIGSDREEQYLREMGTPRKITLHEGTEYESHYNVRVLNENCKGNGKKPLVCISGFTQSYGQDSRHGQESLETDAVSWQIAQHLSSRAIIAISNAGTSDVETTGLGSQRDPETIPFDYIHCIKETLIKEWGSNPPPEIDIFAQSMGGPISVAIANNLEGLDPDLRVNNLTLSHAPSEETSGRGLVWGMSKQELPNILLYGATGARRRFLNHVLKNVIPRVVSGDSAEYCRQIQFVGRTPVQAANIGGARKIGYMTTSGDRMSTAPGFLSEGPSPPGSEAICLTLDSDDGHTYGVLNPERTGVLLELMYAYYDSCDQTDSLNPYTGNLQL